MTLHTVYSSPTMTAADSFQLFDYIWQHYFIREGSPRPSMLSAASIDGRSRTHIDAQLQESARESRRRMDRHLPCSSPHGQRMRYLPDVSCWTWPPAASPILYLVQDHARHTSAILVINPIVAIYLHLLHLA